MRLVVRDQSRERGIRFRAKAVGWSLEFRLQDVNLRGS